MRPLRAQLGAATALGAVAALLSLGGCASSSWTEAEVRTAIGRVEARRTAELRSAGERWQESHRELMAALRSHRGQVVAATEEVGAWSAEAGRLGRELSELGRRFEAGGDALVGGIRGAVERGDRACRRTIAAGLEQARERFLDPWHEQCREVVSRVQDLEEQRRQRAPWSALAMLPAARGFYDARPKQVKALCALDSGGLAGREEQVSAPEKILLTRALRNYKEALEHLAPAVRRRRPDWRPVWDGEKPILAESGGGGGGDSVLAVAVANKAYACDTLARTRGGREGYDLLEIGYYVNELRWCARSLKAPFSSRLRSVVERYAAQMDRRAPLGPAP